MTDALPRGDYGVSQGSREGMCNFSVYSDNIQSAIVKPVPGIVVVRQVMRYVAYANDDSPVNPFPIQIILTLHAIASLSSNYQNFMLFVLIQMI